MSRVVPKAVSRPLRVAARRGLGALAVLWVVARVGALHIQMHACCARGLDLDVTWALSECYLGAIWALSGRYLGAIWALSERYLSAIWE